MTSIVLAHHKIYWGLLKELWLQSPEPFYSCAKGLEVSLCKEQQGSYCEEHQAARHGLVKWEPLGYLASFTITFFLPPAAGPFAFYHLIFSAHRPFASTRGPAPSGALRGSPPLRRRPFSLLPPFPIPSLPSPPSPPEPRAGLNLSSGLILPSRGEPRAAAAGGAAPGAAGAAISRPLGANGRHVRAGGEALPWGRSGGVRAETPAL